MVDIKVYSVIANKEDGVFLSMMGMNNAVFSADTVKKIFDQHQDEKEFRFNIHCEGGSVLEGLAIYDLIRHSGKTIHTNIEGSCHSMAVVLLLAAPKENRTANRNSRALIHEVRAITNDQLSGDELRRLAEEVEAEQNTILDIYADRTGHDRSALETLMKSERILTAQQLKEYGFIHKINEYTTNKITNQKNETMSKNKKEVINSADTFLKKLKNLLNGTTMNYDFKDPEGNLIFSTEGEDDTLEEGMAASPDGEYTLTDGTIVKIAEGEIAELLKPVQETETSGEVAELEARVEALENALQEADKLITNLKNEVSSTYNVRPRLSTVKSKAVRELTKEEKKKEAKEKMNKAKGGGK